MATDWDILRAKQNKINADIARIKQEQQLKTLSKTKQMAVVTGNKKAQANIDKTISKEFQFYVTTPSGNKVQVSKGLYDKSIQENKKTEFMAAQQQARQDLIPPTTSKQRAEAAVSQVQLRAATSPTSAMIPLDQNISVSLKESTRPQQKQEEISPGFANRIETMLQREKNLAEYKSAAYERMGIADKPSDTLLVGVGKAVAQTPFEILSAQSYLGGRAAFAAESLFSRPGRQELWEARGRVPKAVGESYDLTTPHGLVNLGIAAFGAYSLGKSFAIARQNKGFVSNEAATMRSTSQRNVFDETMVDIKARLGAKGQKAIDIKGVGDQEYIKISDTQFGVKGAAQLLQNGRRTATIDIRGTATKVEGGYDVFTISKVTTPKGKVSYLMDKTQTADLLYEPFVSFKTLSSSSTVGAKQSIFSAKPSQITAGSTGEIYIQDIFTGKNIFRTTTKTAQGEVLGTNTLLGSNSFGLRAGTFEQEFVTIRNTQPSLSPSTFDVSPKGGAGGMTVTSVKLRGETLPTTTANILTQVGKTQAIQSLKAVRSQQAINTGARSASLLGINNLPMTTGRQSDYELVAQPMPQTRLKSRDYLLPSTRLVMEFNPIQIPQTEPITKTKTTTRLESQSIHRMETGLRPILTTEQIPMLVPTLQPQLTSQHISEYVTTPSGFSFPGIGIPPILLPPIPFKGLPYVEFGGRPKKGKRVSFSPKYFASIEATALGIRGKASKRTRMAVTTGLDIRPIKVR